MTRRLDRVQTDSPEGLDRRRIAVIDIGSNSVRLVVFDGLKRAPIQLFNEKVLCGLGRGVAVDGAMDRESMDRATEAVSRFAALARDMDVGRTVAVATAAVRDAANGDGFVHRLQEATGLTISTLGGEDEARYSAEGVLAGCPDADGLMGDLGGGSLELVALNQGRIGQAATLPLGPLRLAPVRSKGRLAAHGHIDEVLAAVPWLSEGKGRDLYIVGGAWRALGRIHMHRTGYPLHVLHGYAIRARDMEDEADLIAGLGKQSLRALQGVPKERLDTLPLAALALLRLLRRVQPKRIFFSSCGLREGLVHHLLPAGERDDDPLIAAAREVCRRRARSPELADDLAEWLRPFDVDDSPASTRLRRATALLGDIGWRVHPDYRAEQSMQEVLHAQLVGLDHVERLQLALAIYARYTGRSGEGEVRRLQRLLPDALADAARQRGMALRLAHTLSGGAPGVLPHARLKRDKKTMTLSLRGPATTLLGEVVRRRLETLARACDCDPRIDASDDAAAPPATSTDRAAQR
jgi:exopolyphosphatase/guanosine-5'-triphosphate,3'-diphosphate pyrophosphatase